LLGGEDIRNMIKDKLILWKIIFTNEKLDELFDLITFLASDKPNLLKAVAAYNKLEDEL